ncbi:hypothetical protein P9027_02065 [Bacillus thuringiensis]|uniref:Phage-like protein n=3 Tax=Bacillus thuringiensis TaxID=1428 RepID=A0A9W3J9I9_BACTU|nr:hypothetical protein [Bacillus thuringiensis]AFQ16487.1 phage-like protein [Bacillus thuringiensis HD-771]MEC2472500.1 hypothetical protein [Bacillus thuringiensis]MEC3220844.1 hypothetical protein [Bacillus thuringiensis]MEC3463097.1 hypothetical protein [Bacillus thuringiensis]MEC3515114.1 hypothetical protein [Bacillus thuringiensis]
MHPKQICADIQSMGAKLVLDGNDLYIENHEKIAPEIELVIKEYKLRIIKYLQGNYSDQDHAVKQTIDKIINFFIGVEQDMNPKINDWFNHDEAAAKLVMELTLNFSLNGWLYVKESVANYENKLTDELSLNLYNRAMAYFKKGA